jgi:predicted MFS family arabinose efflux permease
MALGSGRALAALTAAQGAGQAGTWAAYVAALPTALGRPHPATWVGVMTAAWTLPTIGSRLAGRQIDTRGPRVIGAASWIMAALAAAVPSATRSSVPVSVCALACLALGGTWGVAAGEAAPTWIPGRPDQAAAGTWLVIATTLPVATGPIGASTLLTHAGQQAAWAFAAGLFSVGAVLSLLVPSRRPERTDDLPAVAIPDVRRVMVITVGIYLSVGVITVGEALYVTTVLRRSLVTYGWLLGVWAVAGMVTAIATRNSAVITGRRAVPWAVLTLAAGATLYLSTASVVAAFAGSALFGVGAALVRQSCRVVLTRTPPAVHGRVLSWWETSQCAGFAAPTLVAGSLITVFGLRAVLDGSCAFAAMVALACFRRRGRHRRRASWMARAAAVAAGGAAVASDTAAWHLGARRPVPRHRSL